MIFLGVDPDLHNTGAAAVDQDGKVVYVQVITVSKALKRRDAAIAMCKQVYEDLFHDPDVCDEPWGGVAIEGQKHLRESNANPDTIIWIAMVSGAAITTLGTMVDAIHCPLPQEWKGSVPKPIHQKRICTKLSWGSQSTNEYTSPSADIRVHFGIPPRPPWKHIMDAIGLAQWERDQWLLKEG